jgi:hypothetical protein
VLVSGQLHDDVTLLQLSQQRMQLREPTTAEKIEAIAKTKDEQQASLLVQDLAESAVDGKVVIDDGAKAALNAMKTTLENSQNLIEESHTTDQNLRNSHADKAAACLSTYDSSKAEDAVIAGEVSAKHISHTSCRAQLALDDADMITKCDDLTNFINQINPPCSAPGRSGMAGFWSGLQTYHDGNFPTWQAKEQACAEAEAKRAATDAECDNFQHTFETGFCSLRLEMTTTCNEYGQCHALAEDEFNDVVFATTQAETSRKIEWVAIEKIKCYIDVLVSDDDNDAKQTALTACKDLVPDTAHLTLILPVLPSKVTCDLSPIASYPCTDGFVTSRYAGLMDVEACQPCQPLPAHLIAPHGSSCTVLSDDGQGWSPSQTYDVSGTLYHSYDIGQKTVEKTIHLLPGVNYKWTAVIDTWASVDNEPMKFCAVSAEFGEDCDDFTSRPHNACSNGWTEHPANFGTQVGSPGSSNSGWKDCYKDFEKTITGPADGTVTLRMFMDINQERADEAWGWHNMKLEPTSCPTVHVPFELASASEISSRNAMLAAGWSWTGCPVDYHGGDNLLNGIWCHSEAQMHLKVPPLGGTGTCTATWSNGYGGVGGEGFVRLMKNGQQLGEALANEEKTVTFSYTAGDELEFWEGFAIAKAKAGWLQCDTGAAATSAVNVAVDTTSALVIDTKTNMLAAGWTWTGCSRVHHGGDSLANGIWCHSQEQMHLHVPLAGGPGSCTATFKNNHNYHSSENFVRLVKNGQTLATAMSMEEKTVDFTFAEGDNVEFWEGFAIIKVAPNWLHCP